MKLIPTHQSSVLLPLIKYLGVKKTVKWVTIMEGLQLTVS